MKVDQSRRLSSRKCEQVLVHLWSFNSESSLLRAVGTEVKSPPIECRELQMHCFAYCDAHLSGHRIVSPQSDAARVIESVEFRCE
jgi:hypothetical protein